MARRLLALCAFLIPVAGSAAAPSYVVTEIGPGLMGTPGFNDLTTPTPRLDDTGRMAIARNGQLVIWQNGITTEIAAPDGAHLTKVLDMNRSGDILLGFSTATGGGTTIYRNGVFSVVGGSETCCTAFAFNDARLVVASRGGSPPPRGVYLTDSGVDPIPDSPLNGTPFNINNAGNIAGFESVIGSSTPYFQAGSTVTRPDVGEFNRGGFFHDLNESGVAVGWLKSDFRTIPVRITGSAMDPLPTVPWGGPPDVLFGVAYGIDETGNVVGQSRGFDDVLRPTLWQQDGTYDLNNLIVADLGGRRLLYAYDISDRGQIIALGGGPFLQPSLFLLTPVPEPATLTLVLAGLMVVVAVSRKSGVVGWIGKPSMAAIEQASP